MIHHPIDRRTFVRGAGALFLGALAPRAAEALERTQVVFVAACARASGAFGCAVFDENGRILSTVDLPDQGHDVTFDPGSRLAVAFARRPRTFAVVFDPFTGRHAATILSEPNRHFFGHGFFSPDGALLYATENEIDTARGVIGVYDAAAGFRRIGEFDTGGMDPHEALLLPDNETIVVANGGIETDPDFGRQKLNIPTMDPSLVLLSRRTGERLEQHRLAPDLHQLSIRHLATDSAGSVWFGCQYEGPADHRPPLAGVLRRGRSLETVELDETMLEGLANYVGSVAASRDGSLVAMASPRGNTVLVLDAATGRPAERYALAEGCGLAPDRTSKGLVATGAKGEVRRLGEAASRHDDVVWDNHILTI